ncbi:MAG: hypothetical protein IIX16_05925 [Clostridia bacterium]|nr:hypothetical protein [Clostridia bacterium]
MQKKNLKDDLTILVCSCDAYADLWNPFFTLFKKYWPFRDVPIILNTESKNFSFDGLDIKCIHSPSEKRYGKRMLNALSNIKTKYVLLLLDDFFLRKPVSEENIFQIINWMKSDKNIAYFSCEPSPTYASYEVNKYPGFKRVPPASDYTLNMQAAIWQTKILKEFWRPSATPWEWETIYNPLILKHPEHKFYCPIHSKDSFLDYGHYAYGDIWGVYRGKWVTEDVDPLFKKENIEVDYSIRGIYPEKMVFKNESVDTISSVSSIYAETHLGNSSVKSLGDIFARLKKFCEIRSFLELPFYIGYEVHRIIKTILKKSMLDNYFTYILKKERKRFLSSSK